MKIVAIKKYFNSCVNTTTNLITYLENLPIPFINYFLTFACILILRNFLEGFSHNSLVNLFYINNPATFLIGEFCHFSLFYTCIACALILILYYFSQEKIQNIIRVLLPAFVLILSAPIVDIIASGGMGHHIAYLYPNNTHNLLYYYFTFFGSAPQVFYGIRLEILATLFCVYIYLHYKQKSIFITMLSLLSIYSVIFFISATPFVIKYFANIFCLDIQIVSGVIICYFLLLLFPLGISIGFLANKKVFIALAKDLRWLRLLHFELMLWLGVALTIQKLNILHVTNLIFLSISILFFWLSAIMLNNIYDQDIDRISNPKRPLIKQVVELKQYETIAYAIVCCSLIYAAAVNIKSLLFMSGAILASASYSIPPLRLKRIPIFSKVLTSAVSLTFILLGYITVHGSYQDFPRSLIWIFLLGFTLAVNLIDIKDYAGDKAGQIMTLPVLLTPRLAKLLIGIAFILTSASFYLYLKNIYLLPGLLFVGISGFYFINQEKYQEWKVMFIYLLSIVLLISYILVNNLCS